MKSTINLKIYNRKDEIIAEFEETRIRWGVIEDAVDLVETLANKSTPESIRIMGKFLQLVFPELTDDLLREADFVDVKNCFQQIISIAKQIGDSTEIKNAEPAKQDN